MLWPRPALVRGTRSVGQELISSGCHSRSRGARRPSGHVEARWQADGWAGGRTRARVHGCKHGCAHGPTDRHMHKRTQIPKYGSWPLRHYDSQGPLDARFRGAMQPRDDQERGAESRDDRPVCYGRPNFFGQHYLGHSYIGHNYIGQVCYRDKTGHQNMAIAPTSTSRRSHRHHANCNHFFWSPMTRQETPAC